MEQHPQFAALVASDGQAIWDKLKKEPARAYATFCQYREMGANRSIPGLAKLLGRKSYRRFLRWSVKWQWQKRCAAYDAEMDRRWRGSKAGEVEQTAKRHKAIAHLMQKISMEELNVWASKIEAEKKEAEKEKRAREPTIDNLTSLRLLGDRGVVLERLINGDPTEIGENKDSTFDPSQLTTEELRELRRLQDKAKKGA